MTYSSFETLMIGGDIVFARDFKTWVSTIFFLFGGIREFSSLKGSIGMDYLTTYLIQTRLERDIGYNDDNEGIQKYLVLKR